MQKINELSMKFNLPHAWPTTLEEAVALQKQLRSEVVLEDQLGEVKYVAGVDVAFEENYSISRAAVVVLSFPDLQVVEQAIARRPTTFPYIPGFLSFRETPVILDALKKLTRMPDLIFCDGQGIAHPRGFGIACHLGLLTNIPTVGVAKSLLVGKHDELPLEKGAWKPLIYHEKTVGVVLRSRMGIKPLYVSPGHRISLSTAMDYVLQCLTKYRLPETTRLADKLSKEKTFNPTLPI